MLAILALTLFAQDSKHLIQDPAAPQRVDYLVLAADEFAGGLDELASYRSKQGLAVGIVKMSALQGTFDSIRAFLAHAVGTWTKPAPRYLLLVGDVDKVPSVLLKGQWTKQGDPDLMTDFEYACPRKELESELHVGRFPCDTPEELASMVRKTIDYETKLEDGEWQKRVNFIAGRAGFSPEVDAAIERAFIQVVAGGLPAAYDIEVAYGNPKSAYCPFPPKFAENALRLVNEGSLVCVYVGHGRNTGVANVYWKGESFPVLNKRDAEKLAVQAGLPVMVILACSTGELDAKRDCIAEEFFKAAKGPVGFLAGSRVTQPYANALLGQALCDQLFLEGKTLGECVTLAKMQVLRHERSLFTQQADFVAAQESGPAALQPMRQDGVRHYNLLGDPALVLRRPKADVKLALDGGALTIEAPARELTLVLERAREVSNAEKLDENDPEVEAKMAARYRKANDRVIRTWTVRLEGGRATLDVELPKEPGRFVLKAHAPGRFGSLALEVKPEK